MNKILKILPLLVLLITACSDPVIDPPEDNDPPSPPAFTLPEIEDVGYDFTEENEEGWTKIWEENFDGNLSDWNIWQAGAFNNELQLYKSSNLYVENDFLYIRQKRESASGAVNPFDSNIKAFTHTSGRIETKTRYSPSQTGGVLRYAARIRLPEGEGLWPAFWSYGDPWPTQGEIDVMEFRGGETDVFKTNFFYGENPNQVLTNSAAQTMTVAADNLTTEFHVYELEWTEDRLLIKLDGEERVIYNANIFNYVDDMFTKSQQIVLNLAVGGDFFSDLDPATIPSDSYMIVDWVKVYRK